MGIWPFSKKEGKDAKKPRTGRQSDSYPYDRHQRNRTPDYYRKQRGRDRSLPPNSSFDRSGRNRSPEYSRRGRRASSLEVTPRYPPSRLPPPRNAPPPPHHRQPQQQPGGGLAIGLTPEGVSLQTGGSAIHMRHGGVDVQAGGQTISLNSGGGAGGDSRSRSRSPAPPQPSSCHHHHSSPCTCYQPPPQSCHGCSAGTCSSHVYSYAAAAPPTYVAAAPAVQSMPVATTQTVTYQQPPAPMAYGTTAATQFQIPTQGTMQTMGGVPVIIPVNPQRPTRF